jgi:hypothetical protein
MYNNYQALNTPCNSKETLMLHKVHSPVGVATGVIGFGFLIAAAVLPDGPSKYLALGAWVVLNAIALVVFGRARRAVTSTAESRWLRDAHLVIIGAAALVVATAFGSAFSGAVGAGAIFVLAATLTNWIYLPRIRAREAAGRL